MLAAESIWISGNILKIIYGLLVILCTAIVIKDIFFKDKSLSGKHVSLVVIALLCSYCIFHQCKVKNIANIIELQALKVQLDKSQRVNEKYRIALTSTAAQLLETNQPIDASEKRVAASKLLKEAYGEKSTRILEDLQAGTVRLTPAGDFIDTSSGKAHKDVWWEEQRTQVPDGAIDENQ